MQQSAVTQLRTTSYSSQRHRLAFYGRFKSRAHRLDGDKWTYLGPGPRTTNANIKATMSIQTQPNQNITMLQTSKDSPIISDHALRDPASTVERWATLPKTAVATHQAI
jgi:hypothetical protein